MQRRDGLWARWVGWACLVSFGLAAVAGAQRAVRNNLSEALRGSGASAIALDVRSGRVLAQVGDVTALAAPGSAVKPFVLRAALESGVIGEHTTVHCEGTLRVAGHNLACVHPRDVTVLDARQALAESCNTYFATVARRMTDAQMVAALRGNGRGGGLRVERAPADADQRELMGLGLLGARASVREMAEAYRGLALWMAGGGTAASVVRDGLVASVETGVAHAAHVDGLVIAGKTGTVDMPGSGRSQGWFAGLVYGAGGQPERVVVVFCPSGNGRDAAALARRVLVGQQ